ncbi:hypothetical protein JYU34_001226 [Plutella xylostella]|uniref:Uncharacterized protein n=1 Tax=Plutella xylostella TaxID=51655 RepID=A0ABQ7R6C0_PLUXY|nr:hypothetical protein JYU34_001226 [Plutella xylostella]
MSKIVLLFVLSGVLMISSHPLLQSLQSCPIHGNKALQNALLSALPMEIPFNFNPQQLLQQLPQQYAPQQPVACQNSNCQSNNCQNPIPNEVSQSIVSRVLSNPAIQAIVNQNSKPPNPNTQVVNNYFIIPPELLLNETKNIALKPRTPSCNAVDTPYMPYPPCRPQCNERPLDRCHQCLPRQNDRCMPCRRPEPPRNVDSRCRLPPKTSCDDRPRVIDDQKAKCENTDKCKVTEEDINPCGDFEYEEDNRPQIKRSGVKETVKENNTDGKKKSKTQQELRNSIREMLRNEEMIYRQREQEHLRRQNQKPKAEKNVKGNNNQPTTTIKPVVKPKENTKRPSTSTTERKQQEVPNKSLPKNNTNNTRKNGTAAHGQINKGNRMLHSPNDDAIILEMKKKYPEMSEAVIRDLLGNVKKQYRHQQSPYPMGQYYYPGYPPPHYNNYNQGYPPQWYLHHMPHPNANQMRPNQNGAQRNGVSSNANSNKQNTTTISTTPNINKNNQIESNNQVNSSNTLEINNTTNKTTTTVIPVTKTVNDVTEATPVENVSEEPKVEEMNASFVRNGYLHGGLRALGTEDEIPNLIGNGIVDDYFPDFKKDNLAYSFGDYASDMYADYYDDDIQRNERTITPDNYQARNSKNHNKLSRKEFLRRQNRRRMNARKRINKEDFLVNEENFEREQKVPEHLENKSKEIVYKTPPGLENPDFQTSKLNREYFDPYSANNNKEFDYPVFKAEYVSNDDNEITTTENAAVKSSTYSFAKTPYYYSSTPGNTGRLATPKDIETFFANSKMIKYGYGNYDSDELTTTMASPKTTVNMEEISVTSHFGYGSYGGGFGGGLGGGAIIIGGYKRFGYGGGFYQRPYAPYAPQFFYPRPPPPPFPYPYYG